MRNSRRPTDCAVQHMLGQEKHLQGRERNIQKLTRPNLSICYITTRKYTQNSLPGQANTPVTNNPQLQANNTVHLPSIAVLAIILR